MDKKIAIITGASRGVGEIIAKHLANQHYIVILMARNLLELKRVDAEITSLGGSAETLQIDISKHNEIVQAVSLIIAKHGKIDVLINNAGICRFGTSDIDEKSTREILSINLEGAIFMAQEVAKQMKKQKYGYIINISSISGKVASADLGIYNASKFGLNGFSLALTKELSLYGVKVTAICPAMIATEMTKDFNVNSNDMIEPDDIAKTVDYLLSLSKNAIPSEVVIECFSTTAMGSAQESQLFFAK